jgi:hypothetical protein
VAVRMQGASCSEAIQRDKQRDLPKRALVMKWTQGDAWAVLDADVRDKRCRIIYSDPKDNKPKVWDVTGTYERFTQQPAEAAA